MTGNQPTHTNREIAPFLLWRQCFTLIWKPGCEAVGRDGYAAFRLVDGDEGLRATDRVPYLLRDEVLLGVTAWPSHGNKLVSND